MRDKTKCQHFKFKVGTFYIHYAVLRPIWTADII